MNHRKHWENVRALGCCVSRNTETVTIHHCHGGSIRDFFGELCMPGTGKRQNHFLVIPLAAKYHVGDFGIDTGMGVFKGVKDWEETMGTQIQWLLWVNHRLDYDIFDLAGVPTPPVEDFDCEKWMAYG